MWIWKQKCYIFVISQNILSSDVLCCFLQNVHHAGQPMPGEEQEDIVMTSTQMSILNVTCPLTGKPVVELTDPVRWYEYNSILYFCISLNILSGDFKLNKDDKWKLSATLFTLVKLTVFFKPCHSKREWSFTILFSIDKDGAKNYRHKQHVSTALWIMLVEYDIWSYILSAIYWNRIFLASFDMAFMSVEWFVLSSLSPGWSY